MNKGKVIRITSIYYLFLLLYIVSMTTYQLGTGFDALFVRATFAIWFLFTVFLNKKIEISGLLKWGILFWGYYFLSILWTHNKADTIYYVNSCIQILGIFICIPIIVKDKKNIDDILKLVIISLVYSCIILLMRTPQDIWGTDNVGVVMGLHRNVIGVRLSIGFLICIYFIHMIINKTHKVNFRIIILVLLSIIFAVISLLTGSKKAFVSIILGLTSFELINAKGLKLVFKIMIIGLICALLVYIVFNNELLYSTLGSRIEHMILTIQGNNGIGQTDGSLLERQYYIKQAKYLFTLNPIFGYGGNNFMTYMREIGYSHVAYSHNNYWELLSTLGILGFIIYYYMWIKILILLIKDYRLSKSIQSLLFLIIIAIILVLDYGNVSYISPFNMLLFAISYIYYLNFTKNKEVKHE